MTRYFSILFILITGCFTDNPKLEFQKRTGLRLADSTFNLANTDTYFPHEGEYSIVFKTTQSQIEAWLKDSPPWNNKNWRTGQIPHGVGIACQFNFPGRVGVATTQDGRKIYSGDKKLEQLLNDTTNNYVYREDCCSDDQLRFRDGALLIIQPKTKMVYYSNWNY
jgi:hypothetical protein